MNAPTVKTERLTLRPMTWDDFDPYAAMLASPRAVWMKGPNDRNTAWDWFASDIAHWPLFGFGGLTIDIDGKPAGQVAVTRGVSFPEPEIGWFLYDGYEGHGYATEAAAALRAHTYATTDLTTLVSYCSPENAASIAVARRLGAYHDVDAPRPANDNCHVYRHPGPEALS